MNGRTVTIVVMATLTALSLASPLAAAREAGKTPLAIETVVSGVVLVGSGTASGTFTLDLGSSSDSGKLTFTFSYGSLRRSAAGQYFLPVERTETLKGKHGKLVIRSTGRQIRVPVLKEDDEVWTGTWSIVRGTGRYAGLEGGGGFAGLSQATGSGPYYASRYEGLVTRS